MGNKTLSIADITHDSIVDGFGMRTVIWFQGCAHFCNGCHNPCTHKFIEPNMTVDEAFEEINSNVLCDITLSGGDPFYQAANIIPLAKRIKEETDKTIWAYSGWTYEELIKNEHKKELLKYVDVLVDGPFILELRNANLMWRGSSNQRVLKLKDGKIVEQLY